MTAETLRDEDPFFRALYDHQMTSTLRDSCSCGAGDMDTLQPSGVAIQRHRRHLALVLRQVAVRDVQDRLRAKGWGNTAARLNTLTGSASCPRCGGEAGHGPLCGDCANQPFRPNGGTP